MGRRDILSGLVASMLGAMVLYAPAAVATEKPGQGDKQEAKHQDGPGNSENAPGHNKPAGGGGEDTHAGTGADRGHGHDKARGNGHHKARKAKPAKQKAKKAKKAKPAPAAAPAPHGPKQAKAKPVKAKSKPAGGEKKPKAGRATLCHATGSATNPYVTITISENGLHGHGDHEDDLIPAPAGGCPQTTVAPASAGGERSGVAGDQASGTAAPTASGAPTTGSGTSPVTAATTVAGGQDAGARVLGVQAASGDLPDATASPSATATRRLNQEASGSLPFTGWDLGLGLLLAAGALLAGVALRRASQVA